MSRRSGALKYRTAVASAVAALVLVWGSGVAAHADDIPDAAVDVMAAGASDEPLVEPVVPSDEPVAEPETDPAEDPTPDPGASPTIPVPLAPAAPLAGPFIENVPTPGTLLGDAMATPGGIVRADDVLPADDELATATIKVHVGGDRLSSTAVAPLEGVTLGLFASANASTPVNDDWAVAISGPDGVATFTVPITGQNVQYWVKGISAPWPYTLNSHLTTALITSPTNDSAQQYAFQTPPLVADEVYESGQQFQTRQGANLTGSTGTWALTRQNPDKPAQCGIRVALVVDLSASVLQANATNDLREAAKTYVEALLGTPSEVQLFSFGTSATTASALTSVSTRADVDALKAEIDKLTPINTNYTNWDDALWLVKQQAATFDLAVIITDGNPTVYQADTAGRQTRFAEVEAGIFSANALKAEGTRVEAIGVGDAVASANAYRNLQAITGPGAYIQTKTYKEAGEALRDSVFQACAPSLTVVKQVIAYGSDVALPADGWTFDASTDSTNVGYLAPAGTTNQTGAVNFPLSFADLTGGGAQITITEHQQAGYELTLQDGARAVCTLKNAQYPLGVDLEIADAAGDLGFVVVVGPADMVSCTVVNTELPPDPCADCPCSCEECKCDECSDCEQCDECEQCENCDECEDCEQCENCDECEDCEQCENCDECED
ncbi:MAG: VWA domain-containing protein, partial [Micrococcales bacterium]|nr:VWA domain-containing protein [Micrococcales bacterium]